MEYNKSNPGRDGDEQLIFSFPPIVNENCKVLVLGTMPGEESLRVQQYYGHGRNAFWKIIYALFGQEPDKDYERRKGFLLEKKIALWDVLLKCEREGSSDSNIKNPVPNDLAWLFKTYPDIKSVCFNGKEACKFYRRLIAKTIPVDVERNFYVLPSTSPSYRIGFEKKLEEWKMIKKLL